MFLFQHFDVYFQTKKSQLEGWVEQRVFWISYEVSIKKALLEKRQLHFFLPIRLSKSMCIKVILGFFVGHVMRKIV